LLVRVFEFVLLIFSLSAHECAHAWMASRLGDQTARQQGRVTLNPMAHIDPIGTLLIPALGIFGPLIGFTLFGGILIGWAKPTPVITRNFRHIRRDDNLTTLAGPVSNLLIVFAAFVALTVISIVIPGGHALAVETFRGGIFIEQGSVLPAVVLLATLAIRVNFSLFFFNLLPIPPLDGSHLIRNLLPYNAVQVYDSIPIWASYLFMFFIGGFLLRLFLGPALLLVLMALKLV
jgi:Zn-dependent protease